MILGGCAGLGSDIPVENIYPKLTFPKLPASCHTTSRYPLPGQQYDLKDDKQREAARIWLQGLGESDATNANIANSCVSFYNRLRSIYNRKGS